LNALKEVSLANLATQVLTETDLDLALAFAKFIGIDSSVFSFANSSKTKKNARRGIPSFSLDNK
jgi:hypothetical protein